MELSKAYLKPRCSSNLNCSSCIQLPYCLYRLYTNSIQLRYCICGVQEKK